MQSRAFEAYYKGPAEDSLSTYFEMLIEMLPIKWKDAGTEYLHKIYAYPVKNAISYQN